GRGCDRTGGDVWEGTGQRRTIGTPESPGRPTRLRSHSPTPPPENRQASSVTDHSDGIPLGGLMQRFNTSVKRTVRVEEERPRGLWQGTPRAARPATPP